MTNPFKKLFSTGAEKLVEVVGNAFDKNFTTKEEREQVKLELTRELNRAMEAMQDDLTKQYELQLKDVADSRNANMLIQTSDKSSFLSKNVGYFIDLFVLLMWGVLSFYIAGHYLNLISSSPGVDFSGIWGLYASVTGMATVVLTWHRGSSKGSEDKQRTIDRMTK